MAKNPKNVWDFENDLKQKLRKKAENDVQEMLNIKSDRLKTDAKIIYSWEAGYYENQVKLKKYDLDAEEVRQYFEFNNVTSGLFTIYQRLFNVRFEKVENPYCDIPEIPDDIKKGYHILQNFLEEIWYDLLSLDSSFSIRTLSPIFFLTKSAISLTFL